ncbi:uncharacterized protein si:ch211-183d21.1 [Myxocyprinus asiaticus]|uniref:uncharacterized protein si:ch211-183d21.1 n=1 Tax=Myxocyprinus asiaticus TaxID=70543 RepID=UPI00222321E4|nr:uncharacterized protein si:ch211-183d21.1 [Myxocyprinus asiaticus]
MLRIFRSVAMRVELLLNLVCVVFLGIFDVATPCLMISEINCDNPKLDTQEFVELYNEGSNPASLDGYTLVFYNGNGDQAYRVIDLSGHQTDQRGYFLVGSSELIPRPTIILPPNSVQNGPDAIALYGPNWTPVLVNGHVSRVGLIDAVVYTSRKSAEGADGLASVLTPGSVPYVEDELALLGDESIQRCWQSENLWTFHTGPPTPGWVNHCPPPTPGHVWINEVDLGGPDQKGLVELNVGMVTGSFSVVLYDVTTDLISSSVEFSATGAGFVTLHLDTGILSVSKSAALAVYKGPASDFPKGSPLSHQQPIDAFVYSDSMHMPSDNLTETLIPGRKPFILTESFHTVGLYGSRCGVAEWTRDPGLFVTRPRSPGKANDCVWFQSCPRNITSYTSPTGRLQPPFHSNYDFLLNEINSDSPGAAEDEEFIELWHPSGYRMSLDFIWLVMINGQTGKPYFELELSGHYTDDDGYFLIGSAKLAADVNITVNTIQNGPDAIALYRSESPPSMGSQSIPTDGLLDAVVYRTRGSDKKSLELTEALTPGQLPLLEDSNALPGDETLTRCGAGRINLSSYRVASPTPRKMNDCPATPNIAPPPGGVVFNEFGLDDTLNPFVELVGPPLTSLLGIILVFFVDEDKKLNYPLTGSTGSDGFYFLKNSSSADQGLPDLTDFSAVVLCFEPSGSGVCGTNSSYLDRFISSNNSWLESILQYNTSDIRPPDIGVPAPGMNSVSRCASDGPIKWIISQTTPRLQNLCPSPAHSVSVDLCLQPENNDWQGKSGNCAMEGFSDLLEQICNCGIRSVHLKGVNVSCVPGRVYAVGSVFTVSDQQRVSLTSGLDDNKLLCSAPQEQQVHGEGASVGLQVGLVLTAVLLFGLGAALFVYLYKKRRPADYLSMQLNEQADTPLQL